MRRLILALCLLWSTSAGAITKPVYGTKVNKQLTISQGIIGAWLLNEGSGTTAYDSSGVVSPNNLTIQGTTLPTWVTGAYGPALSFPAANTDSVVYGALTVSPPFTVALSLNPSQTASYVYVTDVNNSGNHRVAQNASSAWEVSGLIGSVLPAAVSGTRQTVVYEWTSTTAAYLNVGGTPVTGTTTAKTWNNTIYIGGRSSGTSGFQGIIDYAIVWNRALSASEITLLNSDPFAPYRRPAVFQILRNDQPRGRDALAWLGWLGWLTPWAANDDTVLFHEKRRLFGALP